MYRSATKAAGRQGEGGWGRHHAWSAGSSSPPPFSQPTYNKAENDNIYTAIAAAACRTAHTTRGLQPKQRAAGSKPGRQDG
jgi:hypothetical protein